MVVLVAAGWWVFSSTGTDPVRANLLATRPDESRASSLPQLEKQLVDLLATTDPTQRVAALHGWFRANLPARLAELRGFFARMHEQANPDLFTAFQVFLEEWGALDGAAAYAFAYDSPQRSGIDGYAEFAIRGWLRGDFDGLWRFVQAQAPQLAADHDRARWAVTWFTEALMDADPARFFRWIDSTAGAMNPHLRDEIARTAAFHASDDTIDRAGEWLRRNERQVAFREIVGEFARRYAEMRPAQAADWTLTLEDPAHRGTAAVVVARRLASHDYELGVQWLARPAVVESLRGAPAQWRAGEKPASAYDAAVTEYLSTLARHHGDDPRILQAAEASVAAVLDPEVRKHLAARIDEVRVTYFGRPTP